MTVIYYRHGESGASILDAASVNLDLRQDGRPKGRDSLLALFTTAVSLQGRRPEKKHLYPYQWQNNKKHCQPENAEY
ncbi:hypothetical protein VKQ53_26945 [Escherichia coli]|uniref:hypothetical protein n=1 Tax=Enterobacteriaceae TaxID=543 RepID=UPI0033145101|nr:hypothetical protein [Enterobacter hormaechei subsp. hoffmannii]